MTPETNPTQPTVISIVADLQSALTTADHQSGFSDYKALWDLSAAVAEAISQMRGLC